MTYTKIKVTVRYLVRSVTPAVRILYLQSAVRSVWSGPKNIHNLHIRQTTRARVTTITYVCMYVCMYALLSTVVLNNRD